ncbi:hypothetical protein IAE35_23700 [Pseudomonas sp. S75]|uniref:hypothetical protein n=1 Tax=unclassified Pseudomonas TaxID=196821 RepID=UPI0019068317|nr:MULTISPECIES: hypothetical protein [unclassified Pseudomonas]MBJ9978405.1 hypothetical protein [Pseudomonas sp. S30]MBK0156353.1 hypothetical protein [Pseudomonas sp. S75]
MIKPKSRFQAYALLFIYLVSLFFVTGVMAKFLLAAIVYYEYGAWSFGWGDVFGVFPGFLAYAVPVWLGICLASYFKWGSGE